jgi:iron complex outermembrane recepter protein
MIRAFLFSTIYLFINIAFGQQADSLLVDSTRVLDEITVQAYEYDRPLIDIPAAIGIVKASDFERYNNASLLPAVNAIAGVRMEERSPGSYRLSIRGSTLRSPFGVRNIKVYWNDLPFTDPGGNTYLNLIDPGFIGQTEIIKGPGSSLYGAGTGGVLLFKSQTAKLNTNETYLSGTAGSFGLITSSVGIRNHTEKSNATIHYAHQQSEGYRDQSAMRRDVLQTQGSYHIDNKRIISANFLYADMYYETPGGLTLQQYQMNRRQARPAAGPNAGAVEQKATVYNRTFYAGISQTYEISNKWSNRTGAYLSFTQFENPTIRNYERRAEQSFGARSVTQYKGELLNLTFGAEYQQGFSPIKVYDNNGGEVGALQTDNEITSVTGLIFSQAELNLSKNFFLTIGGSLNFNNINFKELSSSPSVNEKRGFKPVLSPRVAVLKKLNSLFSVYGSISQGFSPPTSAEIYPSAAVFDKKLTPEKGNNYEIGFRGLISHAISFDVVAYVFAMRDAITTRRNEDGGEYFVNVGSTLQKGLECNLSFNPKLDANNFIVDFKVWSSVTINRYTFDHYTKDTVNTKTGLSAPANYSGNKLTGVAPNIIAAGCDINFRSRLYCNITVNYTDKIPLNDGNTAFADRYVLLGGRAGYKPAFKKLTLDFFVGADNLLDQRYSLGNDLNAQAGRFYNAAPARNFFIGLKTNLTRARHQ